MSDWTCHVLNTYLRYYDLDKIDKIIKSVESRLQQIDSNSLQIDDLFLVAGDFSATTIETETARYLRTNVERTKHRKQEANTNLEDLGFYSVIDSNSTLFSHDDESVLMDSATAKSKVVRQSHCISSCNILCREKMPSTRSAFREALYKTKSPLTIYDDLNNQSIVPSAKGDKLCGYWGVVRQGLCHMAIPKGYTWGGSVSQHCPVWIEMYKLRERIEPSTNTSIEIIDDDTEEVQQQYQVPALMNKSTTSNGSTPKAGANVKRQLYQQRRNSLNSNVSHKRMNGHAMNNASIQSAGAACMTNGDLNASSDSVFLSN